VPSLAILVSAVLVLSRGQTDRITEADQRYTQATTVGVSVYRDFCWAHFYRSVAGLSAGLYRRVYDVSHLLADCLETGISSEFV